MTTTTVTLGARRPLRMPDAFSRLPWRMVGKELAIWSTYYGAYLAVRGQTIGSAEAAIANARTIVDAERTLGIFREADLQRGAAALQDVLSTYYMLGFAPLLAVVMVWLAAVNRSAMAELRTALLIGVGIASIMYVTFPVAPPRLVPDLGMVDTVGLGAGHDTGSFAGIKFNPYAAMPSMHVGWSLLVGIIGFRAARNRWTRGLFAAHPVVMTVTVMVTGNHYIADAVVGAAVALVALAITRYAVRRRRAAAAAAAAGAPVVRRHGARVPRPVARPVGKAPRRAPAVDLPRSPRPAIAARGHAPARQHA